MVSVMDQIFPTFIGDVDPIAVYAADSRPDRPKRPWLLTNMVASIDGAVTVEGKSGGLGGPGDKAVFDALRYVADIILVASGTAINENYGAPVIPDEIKEMRVARGQAPKPRIAMVTRSLSIKPEQRVFDPAEPPIIITHEAAPADRREALSGVADILNAGETEVDPHLALEQLADQGAKVVLLEGGPTLNGPFVDADLIDEWCHSNAPSIVGGTAGRVVNSTNNVEPRLFGLDRTIHDDGFLFHRYVRDHSA